VALPDADRLHRLPAPLTRALGRRLQALALEERFSELLQTTGEFPDAFTRPARLHFLRKVSDPTAFALRALLLEDPITSTEARLLLGDVALEPLLDARLLVARGDDIVCPFPLRFCDDVLFFGDDLRHAGEAVMSLGRMTISVTRAALPNQRVSRALDLGCGAGTLALLLAPTAAHVVGTDINPRAVALAKLNASLNGILNVEFLAGDGFAPVRGERFDVILSQPPYYPNPRGASIETYLHGGVRGDELAWRIATEAPSYLTPAGKAVIFASWTSGRPPIHTPDLKVLELSTNRRELHGTRQGITVAAHAAAGEAWHAEREVAADRWGEITRAAIEQIFAVEDYLLRPSAAAEFEAAAGLTVFLEGSQTVVQGAPGSWLGTVPVDEATRAVLESPNAGHGPEAVRAALRRGLLALRDAPTPPWPESAAGRPSPAPSPPSVR